MKLPTWLSEAMSGMGSFFRTFLSIIFCGLAGIVAFTVLNGTTDPVVAYPMLALVSSLLFGLGLLRWGDLNPQVLLGTVVALVGASISLTLVLKSDLEPGTWELAVASLFVSSLIFIGAILAVLAALAGTMRRRTPRTFAMTLGWLLAYAAIPIVSILYLIGLMFLIDVDLPPGLQRAPTTKDLLEGGLKLIPEGLACHQSPVLHFV